MFHIFLVPSRVFELEIKICLIKTSSFIAETDRHNRKEDFHDLKMIITVIVMWLKKMSK